MSQAQTFYLHLNKLHLNKADTVSIMPCSAGLTAGSVCVCVCAASRFISEQQRGEGQLLV